MASVLVMTTRLGMDRAPKSAKPSESVGPVLHVSDQPCVVTVELVLG